MSSIGQPNGYMYIFKQIPGSVHFIQRSAAQTKQVTHGKIYCMLLRESLAFKMAILIKSPKGTGYI